MFVEARTMEGLSSTVQISSRSDVFITRHYHLMAGLLFLLFLVFLRLAEQIGHAAVSFLADCELWGRGQHFILTVLVIYLCVGVADVVHLE